MPSTPLKREKSGRILSDKYKSDDLKLLEVFEIYKDDLQNEYVNLYYALLGWKDSHLRELPKEQYWNQEIISITDVENLLNKYCKKFEYVGESRIRLIDKNDGSFTIIEIADDKKSVTYEGRVIGGLDELEKRL